MGKQWKQCQTLFFWAPKLPRMVTTAMKLKDPCSLEEKLDRVLSLWEKAMAPHSSALAWRIPWAEEPGGLQSMGSLGVRHGLTTSLSLFTFMHWRRKWQPTPVFLPGESQEWVRSGTRVPWDPSPCTLCMLSYELIHLETFLLQCM